jgi:hypothetical protein
MVILGWPAPIETYVTTTAGITYTYNQIVRGYSLNIDAANSLLDELEENLLLTGEFFSDGGEYDCHYNCAPSSSAISECEASGAPDGSASYWDWYSCTCIVGASPIIIDLDEGDLNLTDPNQGVRFDILARGTPVQVAWTRSGTSDAFLVLDRNNNGAIDDAKELFGNYTDQPASPGRRGGANGFLALEAFDQPNEGGNGDKQITEEDAVYGRLRLWIDANHDGVSQPDELTSLADQGVRAISLRYVLGKGVDGFGNLFRYRGHVTMDRSGVDRGPMKRQAMDVILRYVAQ